jgi:hypothetical protein
LGAFGIDSTYKRLLYHNPNHWVKIVLIV